MHLVLVFSRQLIGLLLLLLLLLLLRELSQHGALRVRVLHTGREDERCVESIERILSASSLAPSAAGVPLGMALGVPLRYRAARAGAPRDGGERECGQQRSPQLVLG